MTLCHELLLSIWCFTTSATNILTSLIWNDKVCLNRRMDEVEGTGLSFILKTPYQQHFPLLDQRSHWEQRTCFTEGKPLLRRALMSCVCNKKLLCPASWLACYPARCSKQLICCISHAISLSEVYSDTKKNTPKEVCCGQEFQEKSICLIARLLGKELSKKLAPWNNQPLYDVMKGTAVTVAVGLLRLTLVFIHFQFPF